jgi:acylglycerol lipase
MTDINVEKLRAEYRGPHELVSTSDGKTLFVRRWDASRAAPVSVLIFHGLTAYSGPYGPFVADQLTESGYDVFGLDLRGHGLSDGRRGDYPSKERFVADLNEAVALVRSRCDKLVMMGHSLGVLTSVVAAKNNPQAADGLVLVSAAKRMRTGVYPRRGIGATMRALIGISMLQGTPLIDYRREGQVGLGDPLFNFRYSARFYSVLFGAGALKVMQMYSSGVIDSPNLDFGGKLSAPLFVAVGEGDELFSADATKEFCDGIDSDDKEFHVIPGARHAVWPKGSFTPLVQWLEKKF